FPIAPTPVSEWSPNWLAYSRYDGIVITGNELRQMSEPARTALWQYVETGGSLAVLGGGNVPDSWKPQGKSGKGQTLSTPGFGRCRVSESAKVEDWSPDVRAQLINSWADTAAPWKTERTAVLANQQFPVVENIGVPVRGLFLLMLAFVLVIGPANLV